MEKKESILKNAGEDRPMAKGKASRVVFAVLAAIFAVCVAVQVFLAGLATFVDPLNWARHESFVHMIEFVPLAMLGFGFAGRLARRLLWQAFGLFGLVLLMYFTANFTSVSPVVSALHPVVALILSWLSVAVAVKGAKSA
ncbi:DUF6220 domain-containing protein [Cohnella massiliensis]|uniref:DUF6220 domain-containing protein n=1 Tax=Cohnella massiliensis TaxID=1816691 RepID=UPI001FE34517|nr:DUF6220 domain-containing protein [Cohnella massiliensis]